MNWLKFRQKHFYFFGLKLFSYKDGTGPKTPQKKTRESKIQTSCISAGPDFSQNSPFFGAAALYIWQMRFYEDDQTKLNTIDLTLVLIWLFDIATDYQWLRYLIFQSKVESKKCSMGGVREKRSRRGKEKHTREEGRRFTHFPDTHINRQIDTHTQKGWYRDGAHLVLNNHFFIFLGTNWLNWSEQKDHRKYIKDKYKTSNE